MTASVVLAAALSLVAGVVLGLMGGGGSILTVPIAAYVLGLPAAQATATSLVVVGLSSVVATLAQARAGRVRWREGLIFAAVGIPGTQLGSRLARGLPGPLLMSAFALMALATALAMLRPRKAGTADAEPPAPSGPGRMLLTGAQVGLLTGLVGAGGGFMVVPALALRGGLSMPEAAATSLLVIALNSASGVTGALLAGTRVPWPLALTLAGVSIAGSLAGVRLSRYVSAAALKRGFGWMVVVLSLFILAKELLGS